MPPVDELAVDVAAEIASISAESQPTADVDSSTSLEASVPNTDSDIEVPESNFWNDDESTDEIKTDTDSEAEDVSSHITGKTITYKANGQDVTISMEEAIKNLSLVDGARKAFSDRAKFKKQHDQLSKELQEVRKYKESWDKLEALKDDPSRLYQVLTGQSFEDVLKEEMERRELYAKANDDERRMLDQEYEMAAMRKEMERARAERDQERQRLDSEKFEIEKSQLQGKMELEFFKHEIPSSDPSAAARLKKMLWRSAIADLKEYNSQGYKINEKAISKAFRENAAALRALYSKEVDRQVKETTERKKQVAKEKAQIASTRNYAEPVDKDLAKLDPLTLFQRIRKGR